MSIYEPPPPFHDERDMEPPTEVHPCEHVWESPSAWGVILGVSKCVRCGEVARAEHFSSQR